VCEINGIVCLFFEKKKNVSKIFYGNHGKIVITLFSAAETFAFASIEACIKIFDNLLEVDKEFSLETRQMLE